MKKTAKKRVMMKRVSKPMIEQLKLVARCFHIYTLILIQICVRQRRSNETNNKGNKAQRIGFSLVLGCLFWSYTYVRSCCKSCFFIYIFCLMLQLLREKSVGTKPSRLLTNGYIIMFESRNRVILSNTNRSVSQHEHTFIKMNKKEEMLLLLLFLCIKQLQQAGKQAGSSNTQQQRICTHNQRI